MTHRFYVPAASISGDTVFFAEDQRNQLKNVLRLRPGDAVCVIDGSGSERLVRLTELGASARGETVETKLPDTEPRIRLTLLLGMPKGEKLEMILQKCTEIGAAEFLVMETERSVPRIGPERLPGRLARWSAVVREAVEQSGRTRLPTVDGVISFQDALRGAKESEIAFIAYESEQERYLLSEVSLLAQRGSAALMVGPEGGFTESEVAEARAEGVVPVSLGRRILRAETAAIAGTALVVFGAEDQAR
jgi:16S rRNA (uracil1498-N3)-methyltransferase